VKTTTLHANIRNYRYMSLDGRNDEMDGVRTIPMSRRKFLSLLGVAPLAPLLTRIPIKAIHRSSIGQSLHIVAVNTNGDLLYTIRFNSGEWQSFWSDIGASAQLGPTRFADAGCGGWFRDLHVLGITTDGEAWHTIRSLPDTWQRFRNLQAGPGQPGVFTRITCAIASSSDNAPTHILGVTSNGWLWHSIRFRDDWQQFNQVQPVAGFIGRVVDVACAGDLDVVALTDDGQLWHTVRYEDGSWEAFTQLPGGPGVTGFFTGVSFANYPLQVLGISSDGTLWHSIREDGNWQHFNQVQPVAGDIGVVVDVSCAAPDDNLLHVVALTDDGQLWHASRRDIDGTWNPFNNINTAVSGDSRFIAVSATASA
jgi:hypothetical protein